MVDGLESEVECHELDDWAKSVETSSDADSGETSLCDWSVPDPLASVLVVHSLANLVRSIILSDFFTHEEHALISFDFITHGGVNRLSNSHFFVKGARTVELPVGNLTIDKNSLKHRWLGQSRTRFLCEHFGYGLSKLLNYYHIIRF